LHPRLRGNVDYGYVLTEISRHENFKYTFPVLIQFNIFIIGFPHSRPNGHMPALAEPPERSLSFEG
jgi:hypothetical protein